MATKPTPKKTPVRRNSSSDERLVRGSSTETRGDRGATSDARATSDTGLLSDDDFQAFLEAEFDNKVLPTPPKLPGYHLCWLTSESSYDPIQKRMRLGYEPVRRSEMSEFDPSNGVALTRFEGFVTCNELVLCKIPEARYQAIMKHYHHTVPMQEEAAIIERMKDKNQEKDSGGRQLGEFEGDGIDELEQGVAAARRAQPVF